MARKMTPQMITVLEALDEYQGIIHRGATAGMVEQSGGSRKVLGNAVRKGWANVYPEKGTPHYYRTEAGTAALERATQSQPPEDFRERK